MIETVYNNSPIWMQNFFVTGAGLQLHLRRKGGDYEKYLKVIAHNQRLKPDLIDQIQILSLKRIISHCFESVPFYQEWSRDNNITAEDINTIEDIQVLPIVEKEDIRQNPTFYCSDYMLQKPGYFTLNTSGTTGKPLVVFCDKESRRCHYAYWERFLGWLGVDRNSWRATFCGRVAIPTKQEKPPFWRYDPIQKNVLFSSYHLSNKNMPFYIKKLRELRPAYLDGYPSSLSYVANYMLEHKEPPIANLRAAFTSAETLLPYQRDAICRAFQVPVADQYGCTEMAVFISQCEHGSYHVNSDYSLLEVLNKDGSTSSPGEWGEAICTVFVNKTMPLIRYRLGDHLRAPEPSTCPCGLPFPVTKEILGRQDEMIQTPDGRQVGRLDPVFKGLGNLRETQIVQSSLNTLLIRLVPAPEFSETDKQKLINALKARVGDEITFQFEILDQIPRESNGKFRSVISRIHSEKP